MVQIGDKCAIFHQILREIVIISLQVFKRLKGHCRLKGHFEKNGSNGCFLINKSIILKLEESEPVFL